MATDLITFNPRIMRAAFPLDVGLRIHLGAEREILTNNQRVVDLTKIVARSALQWRNPISRCLGYTAGEDSIGVALTIKAVQIGENVYRACSERGLPSIQSLKSHIEASIFLLQVEMKR